MGQVSKRFALSASNLCLPTIANAILMVQTTCQVYLRCMAGPVLH